MKVNFALPNTSMCLVLCYRDNRPLPKVLIPTPANNDGLRSAMLAKKVGFGEIRAVQPVREEGIVDAISRRTMWA
jgi:hypothetical protein